MALPEAIARECEARLPDRLPGALGSECEGSVYHSPRPLMAHPFELADGSSINLCGTCRDNLLLLQQLRRDEELPWDALRQFGNRIRELGRRAL